MTVLIVAGENTNTAEIVIGGNITNGGMVNVSGNAECYFLNKFSFYSQPDQACRVFYI